jgi:hypothetical protein
MMIKDKFPNSYCVAFLLFSLHLSKGTKALLSSLTFITMNTQHLSVVETILSSQPYVQLSLAAVFLLFLRYALSQSDDIPFINPKKSSELTASRPRSAFLAQSKEILSQGHDLYPDQPYRANTDWGEVLILPPSLINELRSDPRLDFLEVAQDVSYLFLI